MSSQKICQCRVARLRNGDAEIITDACEIHGLGVEPDALVLALPLKSELDNAKAWEEAAESLLKSRQIFTHYPLVTAEVKELYGGRYGR